MEIWSKVMETGATPPVDIYPFLHWLPQSVFLNWLDRATHVRDEMNRLYADFLSDIRMRRQKEGGGRGAFMDKVLDQAEGETKKEGGLTYNDHELYFMYVHARIQGLSGTDDLVPESQANHSVPLGAAH